MKKYRNTLNGLLCVTVGSIELTPIRVQVTYCASSVEHGRPAESSAQSEHEDKLSKYLISECLRFCLVCKKYSTFTGVVVQRSRKSPANLHDPIDTIGPPISVKVLKSMKLNIFRLKLIKLLKISHSPKREAIQVWLRLRDGYVPLGDEGHNLEWYGIENGTYLVVYTGE